MDVSIVIVSWNTRDILEKCIESVVSQTKKISCEVIVVDNNSGDGSAEMIKAKFPAVKLIINPANAGFAAANNQGISIAEGRYLLLLNSDTVVLDDAISKVVAFADNNPKAAVVGCRILNPDRTLQPSCFMFPSLLNLFLSASYLYKLFPRSRFFGRERMSWWDRNDILEVDVVTGCFMLVRREAINEVGLMDERFFMYGEETDWCRRFQKAGWVNMFTPAASIIHYGGASAAAHNEKRALLFDRSFVRLMYKHWPKWQARMGVVLMVTFYVLRLLVLLPVLVFKPNERIKAVIRNHIAGLKGLLGGGHLIIAQPQRGQNG